MRQAMINTASGAIQPYVLLVAMALGPGCSPHEPLPLADTAQPFFPVCVAREAGTYQERKYIRLGWWAVGSVGESEIIDADCIQIEP